LQTTFVLRVFEIRGGDISARSLKVQKIEEKRVFHGFLRQNTVFYLPHMEYEGSIGLVTRKMKTFYW
jgi:hypothetical protein